MATRKYHILDEFSGSLVAKFDVTQSISDYLIAHGRYETRRVVLHKYTVVITKPVDTTSPSVIPLFN